MFSVGEDVPRLLINMEPVGTEPSFWTMVPINNFLSEDSFRFQSDSLLYESAKNRRDVFHKSTCDEGVLELAKLLGWEVKLIKQKFNDFFVIYQNDFTELLESQGVSVKNTKENVSTIPNETEENADRLAEQMAKATLDNDDKKPV